MGKGLFRRLSGRVWPKRPRLFAWTGVLSGLIAFGFFYQPVVVQGRSMQPTLNDGQMLLMTRSGRHVVRGGDIVIFRHASETYIKRVYATGGKTVRVVCLNNGDVCLLDEMQSASGIAKALRRHPSLGRVSAIRVPDRQIFVVGDNQNNSVDSRDFGPIPVSSVLGYIRPPLDGGNVKGAPRRAPRQIVSRLDLAPR